jgi:hypothetical protein
MVPPNLNWDGLSEARGVCDFYVLRAAPWMLQWLCWGRRPCWVQVGVTAKDINKVITESHSLI